MWPKKYGARAYYRDIATQIESLKRKRIVNAFGNNWWRNAAWTEPQLSDTAPFTPHEERRKNCMDKFNYNSVLSSVNENFTEQKGRKKAKQKKVFLLFHAETSIVQHRPTSTTRCERNENHFTYFLLNCPEWEGRSTGNNEDFKRREKKVKLEWNVAK